MLDSVCASKPSWMWAPRLSMQASNIERFERDGVPWVRFDFTDEDVWISRKNKPFGWRARW